MLNQLLETIIQILTSWVSKFDSHAQHVEDKLDSLDQTASDIKTNTEPISDIKDNTGAVITPIQNIKANTDSIATSSQTSANNTTAILNNVSTLSTNTGKAAAFAEDCANNTLDIKDKVTTIASDTTQLRANSAELNDMSDKIYEAIKWSLADKYIDETESGPSPMSFDTDIADDLKALNVNVEAQQEGTGDPAPDNIRNIGLYISDNVVINGNSISYAFNNNVFKGVIDVLAGKILITWLTKIYDGTENWGKEGTINFYAPSGRPNHSGRLYGNNLICSMCKSISDTYMQQLNCYISNSGNLNIQIPSTYGTFNTAADFAAWVAQKYADNTPLSIAYILSTPIEIQLTPAQIAAIEGINVITSETNGDIEVIYTESIKHYLDKQDN